MPLCLQDQEQREDPLQPQDVAEIAERVRLASAAPLLRLPRQATARMTKAEPSSTGLLALGSESATSQSAQIADFVCMLTDKVPHLGNAQNIHSRTRRTPFLLPIPKRG
jgi:hypothetical protein